MSRYQLDCFYFVLKPLGENLYVAFPSFQTQPGFLVMALFSSFKANNLCFRNWLEDVLPRLSSTPASQIDSLLPPFWKPASK